MGHVDDDLENYFGSCAEYDLTSISLEGITYMHGPHIVCISVFIFTGLGQLPATRRFRGVCVSLQLGPLGQLVHGLSLQTPA